MELRLARMMANGKPVDLHRNSGITLIFHKGGQIGGRSAINNYGGVFSVMPDGHLAIQLTVVTQMAGAPETMELERKYLDALAETKQIFVEPDRVTLANDNMSMEFAIGRRK